MTADQSIHKACVCDIQHISCKIQPGRHTALAALPQHQLHALLFMSNFMQATSCKQMHAA
jgi:hypothetical protein